ncbi:uncharacterized protein LOC132466449 isoform X1 [Gadus macrocephalus]|uniref:uncharacterized protein LOC132466449 isoform X1 n=1 Tax=Gadus macrocephalus TaxID=80720 RepID=UPI0028CB3DCB|nr:uncharacterized protein LOC132466449 isoform X1 [Gadus macrocephalus]
MMAIFFATTILSTALLSQTQENPQSLSLTKADIGDTVSLHCASLNGTSKVLYWYKQPLGYIPQVVASAIYGTPTIYPQYKLRVTLVKGKLTMRDVKKEDEANYFCQQGIDENKNWNNGTFLSVNDGNEQKLDYQTVVQQPASAQLGDPVALQCSITSQRTDHSNQCQGEPSVYWFRSGPSHPAAIYMNGNTRGECQNSSGPPSAPQSCVYTLPKNNADSSDGTYYCALAACGEVVSGNESKLDTKAQNSLPVNMMLGILLGCCLGVIIILILTRNEMQVCEQCKGTRRAADVAHDLVIQEPQDGETDSLNYAALEFSGRKTKGGKKNTERNQESVYSAVRYSATEVCHGQI